MFQFTDAGRPYEAVATIVHIFAEARATGWTTASWLTSRNRGLEQYTPIAWLKAGYDVDVVIDAAHAAATPLRW